MPFLKQSYVSLANPKLHGAKQFSKILPKSLDPTAYVTLSLINHSYKHAVQIFCQWGLCFVPKAIPPPPQHHILADTGPTFTPRVPFLPIFASS
jgi:hypothetical protein